MSNYFASSHFQARRRGGYNPNAPRPGAQNAPSSIVISDPHSNALLLPLGPAAAAGQALLSVLMSEPVRQAGFNMLTEVYYRLTDGLQQINPADLVNWTSSSPSASSSGSGILEITDEPISLPLTYSQSGASGYIEELPTRPTTHEAIQEYSATAESRNGEDVGPDYLDQNEANELNDELQDAGPRKREIMDDPERTKNFKQPRSDSVITSSAGLLVLQHLKFIDWINPPVSCILSGFQAPEVLAA